MNAAELATLEATLGEGEEARFEDKANEVQTARQHDIDPVNKRITLTQHRLHIIL